MLTAKENETLLFIGMLDVNDCNALRCNDPKWCGTGQVFGWFAVCCVLILVWNNYREKEREKTTTFF